MWQIVLFMVGIMLVVIFSIRLLINRGNKNYGDSFREFAAQEREANTTRSKELPEELFFVPNMQLLNNITSNRAELERVEGSEAAANRFCDSIMELTSKKMLKFDSGITNTELKFTYGATNLVNITEYEENHTTYVNLLNEYAHELYKSGLYEEAKRVLLECIRAKTDVGSVYLLLANIYGETGKDGELRDFCKLADESGINVIFKNKITEYVQAKLKG